MWRKIEGAIVKGEEYFLVLSLVVMTITVFLQVLFRYVLKIPQTGLMEIARYLMISSTFIGAGLGVKRYAHIQLDFLSTLLENNKKALHTINQIIRVIGIIFGLILTYLGFQFLLHSISIGERSIDAKLPLAWFKASIMIGFALLTLHYVSALIEGFKSNYRNNRDEEGDSNVT
ncbi:hypothetical protein BTR23_09560 [Alkalihalophilus pseudofirmus]|nr:hypothetical protein BTR23_09560 [Alkalihalophilus pseudofirmus]